MSEVFFTKAYALFQSLEAKVPEKERESAKYSKLYKQRSELLKHMLEEQGKGNFFGALIIFTALHFLGFGIASTSDIDLIRPKRDYKLKQAGVEKVFNNKASQTLLLNWQSKCSQLGTIGSDVFRKNNLKQLWLGSDRVLNCYKAAGFDDGSSFLQGGWPNRICKPETANDMVKALLTEKPKAKSLQFVKSRLIAESKVMTKVNKEIKQFLDDPQNRDFPDLCDIGIEAKSTSENIKAPTEPKVKRSTQVINGMAKERTTGDGRTKPEVIYQAENGRSVFRWHEENDKILDVQRYAAKKFGRSKSNMQTPERTYILQQFKQPASPTGQVLFKIKCGKGSSIVFQQNKAENILLSCPYSKAPKGFQEVEVAKI